MAVSGVGEENDRSLREQLATMQAQVAAMTAAVTALTQARGPVSTGTTTTVSRLFERYADTWSGETWAASMRATLRTAVDHFGDRIADEVTRAEWIHWRDHVLAKRPTIRKNHKTGVNTPPTTYTVNQTFKRWRSVYRWGLGEGHVTRNPLVDVKAIRGAKKHRHTRPSEEDVIRIICASSPRQIAFVVVGARTGMRASELRTTPWKNVDLELGRIKIEWHRSKTRKERWVPLTSDCVAALKAIRPDIQPRYIFESDRIQGSPVVATTLWIEFRNTVDKLGIEAAKDDGRVVYHDLRHVFASWAVERLPLPVVAAIGGWTDLRTMSRYIQVTDQQIADAQVELERAERHGPKAVKPAPIIVAETNERKKFK